MPTKKLKGKKKMVLLWSNNFKQFKGMRRWPYQSQPTATTQFVTKNATASVIINARFLLPKTVPNL